MTDPGRLWTACGKMDCGDRWKMDCGDRWNLFLRLPTHTTEDDARKYFKIAAATNFHTAEHTETCRSCLKGRDSECITVVLVRVVPTLTRITTERFLRRQSVLAKDRLAKDVEHNKKKRAEKRKMDTLEARALRDAIVRRRSGAWSVENYP
jgi:hypothetical protein